MSDKKKLDEGERNKKIILELVKLAENQLCCDCGAKGEEGRMGERVIHIAAG